ncbi:hypothetical protein BDF19DRAFT_421672 [Syncephalis fuscata]|nr:hypothetical protein BDF19DRAFT_421672 [Syncephalis fuscata]
MRVFSAASVSSRRPSLVALLLFICIVAFVSTSTIASPQDAGSVSSSVSSSSSASPTTSASTSVSSDTVTSPTDTTDSSGSSQPTTLARQPHPAPMPLPLQLPRIVTLYLALLLQYRPTHSRNLPCSSL